ncbi:SAV_6107 family HEPN domain-containing protein [Nostocoides sp. HKS02]|uniref:SAV_6107 family HEPN domain-containing protein n=1 Tax=Nostocoides sp. HKS02 TaxID=1813880 RepID=UPI0018A8082F|nr:SAV_6107 family HEPN domain-containing protein [Tetrasphaera sp. HKS02]
MTSTLDLLDRSRHSLLLACQSTDTTTRHQHARLAALRAAASMLAARRDARRLRGPGASDGADGPDGPDRPDDSDRAGPHSLWALLPRLAPELAEWATFFEVVTADRRPQGQVTAREADDLLRQAELFLDLVCHSLGVPANNHGPIDLLVPTIPCALPSAVGSGR